jgi:hypothetical protein
MDRTVATSIKEIVDSKCMLASESIEITSSSTRVKSVTKTIPRIIPTRRMYEATCDLFASECIVVAK